MGGNDVKLKNPIRTRGASRFSAGMTGTGSDRAGVHPIFGEGKHLSAVLQPPQEQPMSGDPWSRPTYEDLKRVLDNIQPSTESHNRAVERIELSVPAEIVTSRGNLVAAMTREISRTGIGFMHRGAVSPGEVRVKLASETRDFEYRVQLEWCTPCEGGMFFSGGRFIAKLK